MGRQKHTGTMPLMTEAEIRVVHLQAQEHQQSMANTRSQEEGRGS